MELSSGAENRTGLYNVTNSSLRTFNLFFFFFLGASVQVEPNLWLQFSTENYFRTSQYEGETLNVEARLRGKKILRTHS